MKGLKDFRRSLNKDRTSGGRPGAAAPALFTGVKNAVSIQPPKKVIRATRDYRSRAPQELSFHKGDFFHVLSEDSGNADWLEATNPITNARGVVPASYFDVLTNSRPPGAAASPTLGGAGSSSGSAAAAAAAAAARAPPAVTAKGGGGLYGTVKYDFVAERTDELDAKSGEPIIVIAQSNFEWFVAKPIGRLGGPGLIPVAFVEIKDLSTGRIVENVQELIESGVVPKVEEWKKMTADYKKNTIPLGRFDFQQGGSDEPPLPEPPLKDVSYAEPELPPDMPPGEPLPTGIVSSATVDSFHYEQGDYWFRIQVAHIAGPSPSAPPSVPRAPTGEERDLILYRLYEDFYEFQIALLDHFPAEAGRETDAEGRPTERILPLMPGPLERVDDLITSQRRVDLDAYIVELCALPEYILRSELVRLFFEPRPGDHCTVHARKAAEGDGLGQEYSYLSGGIDQVEEPRAAPAVQSNGTSKYSEEAPASASAQDELARNLGGLNVHDTAAGRPHSGSGSDGQQMTTDSLHSRQPSLGAASQQAFIKIKIFHRANDDLVAIRVPPNVTHAALIDKVRERLGADLAVLRYRETAPEPGASGLMRISDDEDLREWLASGGKLTLYADVR